MWTFQDQTQSFLTNVNASSSSSNQPQNSATTTQVLQSSLELSSQVQTASPSASSSRRQNRRSRSTGSGPRFTDQECIIVSQILRKHKSYNCYKYNKSIPKRTSENYKRNLRDKFNSFLNYLQEKNGQLKEDSHVNLLLLNKLVARGTIEVVGKESPESNIINGFRHNEMINCVKITDLIDDCFDKEITYPISPTQTTLGLCLNKSVAWQADQMIARIDLESAIHNELFQMYLNRTLLSISSTDVPEEIDMNESIQENQDEINNESPYLKSLLQNQYVSKQLAQKYLSFSMTQKSYLSIMAQYSSMLNSASEIIQKIKNDEKESTKVLYIQAKGKNYKREVKSFDDLKKHSKEIYDRISMEYYEELDIYYLENQNKVHVEAEDDYDLIPKYSSVVIEEIEF